MNKRLHDLLSQLLAELEEYFDDRQDADFEYDVGFIPNPEMRLLTDVRTAIEALEREPVDA